VTRNFMETNFARWGAFEKTSKIGLSRRICSGRLEV